MSAPTTTRSRAESPSGPADPSLPTNLRRNAALVPTDTAAGRSLAAVIAILTFLAGLCAGAGIWGAAGGGKG